MSSLNPPKDGLHTLQSSPRTSPVTWSWSTASRFRSLEMCVLQSPFGLFRSLWKNLRSLSCLHLVQIARSSGVVVLFIYY